MLIDKYRPDSLSALSFNKEANTFFKAVASQTNMPHIIIEGARGSGKRLRAELYLKEKYGNLNTMSKVLNITVPGKTELKQIHVLHSHYHYQLNPSIHNIYDRSLIQCFMAEILHTRLKIPYFIVILEDADLLSVEAQESMRRTLETCIQTCRFIFLVNNEARLIPPLYSRCVTVKTASPTYSELTNIMTTICSKEKFTISAENLTLIARASNRNLRSALHMLNKYMLVQGTAKPGTPKLPFSRVDYDNVYRHCTKIVGELIKGKNIVDTIKTVREQIYELVNYCVDCRDLLPILLKIAIDRLPATAHNERLALCEVASKRDNSIRASSKDIYHVEGMCLYIFKVFKIFMHQKAVLIKKSKK